MKFVQKKKKKCAKLCDWSANNNDTQSEIEVEKRGWCGEVLRGSTPETAEKHEGWKFLFFYGKPDSNPTQKCGLYSLRMTPSLFRRGRRSSSPNQLIGALDLNREINIPPLQLIYTHSKVMNQIETCQKTQQPNKFSKCYF